MAREPFRATIFGSALLLSACSSPNRLVPLSIGKKWDYNFRWGMEQETGTLEVVREIPVADGTGWELRSPMGVLRLGYAGENLVADQLADSFFEPSLPIGVPAGGKAAWRGWVTSHAGRKPAKAVISGELTKDKVAGRLQTVSQTTVILNTEGDTTTLTTSYAPGDGIVGQEQVSGGKVALSVKRVSGG